LERNTYIHTGEGILRGVILTVILLLIYAVIMTFTEVSDGISSSFYLVTTLVSIMYGSIYAVKKINKRGWLIGIVVAIVYMLIIYIVSVISGNSAVIGVNRILRLLIAFTVGALSGMLGVNL
jgi:putative membrane protein (TIGR04086 family)